MELEQVEIKSTSRFDYVKYDEKGIAQQQDFKNFVQGLEGHINELKSARAKAFAITKLEECYMWIGKAIRDDQIERNGSAPLQEERSKSAREEFPKKECDHSIIEYSLKANWTHPITHAKCAICKKQLVAKWVEAE